MVGTTYQKRESQASKAGPVARDPQALSFHQIGSRGPFGIQEHEASRGSRRWPSGSKSAPMAIIVKPRKGAAVQQTQVPRPRHRNPLAGSDAVSRNEHEGGADRQPGADARQGSSTLSAACSRPPAASQMRQLGLAFVHQPPLLPFGPNANLLPAQHHPPSTDYLQAHFDSSTHHLKPPSILSSGASNENTRLQ